MPTLTFAPPRLCRTCSTELLPHEGRGRPVAFCTIECEKAARAAAARDRRAGRAVPPSPTLVAARAAHEAARARLDAELAAEAAAEAAIDEAVERLRPRYEAHGFVTPWDIQGLSPVELTAITVLDRTSEGRQAHYGFYDDTVASFADIVLPDDDDLPPADPLGDSGFTGVGPSNTRGVSTWESDPSEEAQDRHAAREARKLRKACIDDAIRDARSDALLLGVYELDEATIAEATARGIAKAEGLLAALA